MVIYRAIEERDIENVVEQFDLTWGWKPADGGPVSMQLSRHFVLHYLEPTTRGEIAEDEDGRFLGVTLVRVMGQPVLFPDAGQRLAQANAELESSAPGHRALATAEHWHRVEERMEDEIGINEATQAELELFLVAQEARGKGVGGTLWRSMGKFFADSGVERYYLHTDSTCDVSFYDHQGLERVAERYAKDHPEDVTAELDELDDVFIYAGEVQA